MVNHNQLKADLAIRMKNIIAIKWSNGEKSLVLLIIFLFTAQILLSNSIPVQFGFVAQPAGFLSYLNLGYNQFTGAAFHHVMFALAFVLLCPKREEVVRQAVTFTTSYLITEWLTLQGFIAPNTYILNSLVLLSVFFIAVENIFARKLKIDNNRYLFLVLFGFIHGAAMGNNLINTGASLQSPNFSFLAYSAGLVLGEIAILALLFLLIGKFLSDKDYYKRLVVTPVSVALAAYSIYNVVQLLFVPN